jgi:hypothetical protein
MNFTLLDSPIILSGSRSTVSNLGARLTFLKNGQALRCLPAAGAVLAQLLAKNFFDRRAEFTPSP